MHTRRGQENQDRILFSETGRCLFAGLADGVSACACGGQGAQIACEAAAKLLFEETRYFFNSAEEKIAQLTLDYIRTRLEAAAAAAGRPAAQYASTLSFACVEKRAGALLLFQLGDSAVFLLRNGVLTPAFPAGRTEERGGVYTTCTAQAHRFANVRLLPAAAAGRVLLCSDGAWRRMYLRDRIDPAAAAAAQASPALLEAFLARTPCADDASFLCFDPLPETGGGHGEQ